MLKRKKSHSVLGAMISLGLLTSTLPASAQPIPGETIQQTTQRERLKLEIKQKIKQIKKVVDRLKAAKIAAPILITAGFAVGLLVTAAATALTLVFGIRALKLKRFIKKIPYLVNTLDDAEFMYDYAQQIALHNKNIDWKGFPNKIKKSIGLKPSESIANKALSELIKKLKTIKSPLKGKSVEVDADTLSGWTNDIHTNMVNKIKHSISQIEILLKSKRTILTFLTSLSGIAALAFGLVGTALVPIGIVLGLTPKSVVAAFDNIKDVEQIAQNNPGIVTFQQKNVVANFKKELKSPTVQGMVKSLKLKGMLTQLVDTTIKNNPSLVAPRDKEKKEKKEKKMRKVFAKYIKTKREEILRQRIVDEYAALEVPSSKVSAAQRKLDKQKKKVSKFETRYPGIQAALENTVQKYSEAEDKMLEEIKENLMKAAGTKEFKQEMQRLQQQPIVPL